MSERGDAGGPSPGMTGAALLGRADLESRRDGWLVRGRWSKADLWTTVLADGTPIVVKDYGGKPWLGRVLGRIQLRREQRALQRLSGIRGVPHWLGPLDREGFAMERAPGRRIQECSKGAQRRALVELGDILSQVHARGVLHNDLRGRENVLATEDGSSVTVIDWGGATFFPPGSWRRRLFFRLARRVDEGGLLKWKERLAPETLTAQDVEFLRRFQRWRRLWPFNRKGTGGP